MQFAKDLIRNQLATPPLEHYFKKKEAVKNYWSVIVDHVKQ